MGSSGDSLDWGPPAWTNTVSAGPSYKTIAMMKEYLNLLASGESPHLVNPEESIYSYTANTFHLGTVVSKALKECLEDDPFFTSEPREPPVPVMPERLT